MPTTIMTPEEIIKYGQRVVLFSEKKGQRPKIFFIEGSTLIQQIELYAEKKRHLIQFNPVEIMDIYNKIERVYSRKTKGVLLARRSGNYMSNLKNPLPLRKTGKGMGETLRGVQLAKAAYQLTAEEYQPAVVKQQARQRLKKVEEEKAKKKNKQHA